MIIFFSFQSNVIRLNRIVMSAVSLDIRDEFNLGPFV